MRPYAGWTIQQHLIGGGLIVVAMVLTQVKRDEKGTSARTVS
ncbi:MAG TPA: hypothetical protein VHL58_11555 [Thermoanaerobaculia bacterium]|nr:hypothetical protein [Thermoanaerobaculia bacterium]